MVRSSAALVGLATLTGCGVAFVGADGAGGAGGSSLGGQGGVASTASGGTTTTGGAKPTGGGGGTGGHGGEGGATAPEWVPIAGGTFQMGSTQSASEQPVHEVTVPGFELHRTEVTVAQYRACMTDGACAAPAEWSPNCYWNTTDHDDFPVNCVDWIKAEAYCDWAGARLPSEAEWEFAARSRGQVMPYPWGAQAASCDYAVMSDGSEGCGTGLPWSVCSKPNGHTEQGVCDMAGNVWEWMADSYHGDYNGAPNDGSAWTGTTNRLPRGGSYQTNANQLRTTYRALQFGPSYNNLFLGFRCARTAD